MSITLDQVTKHYGGVPVVNDVSLDIGDGEFFVLLGPSGSGKSTLLRAVAGLSGVDHGRISLHGRDVTHVAARKRGVGLVFQNYALFGHMTVADNIEFALRVRHMRARARRERRTELLRLVALEGMDDRLPAQLSGGQQQRVAVARALAHKPEVLLLDEPFGALDAKIREELRRTIRQVQRELGITTVLVTHDQEEAFAMADRIGIMNQGRLLEVGAPHELYARPATRFVATFLGAANLFLARRTPDGIQVGGKTMGSAERSPAFWPQRLSPIEPTSAARTIERLRRVTIRTGARPRTASGTSESRTSAKATSAAASAAADPCDGSRTYRMASASTSAVSESASDSESAAPSQPDTSGASERARIPRSASQRTRLDSASDATVKARMPQHAAPTKAFRNSAGPTSPSVTGSTDVTSPGRGFQSRDRSGGCCEPQNAGSRTDSRDWRA